MSTQPAPDLRGLIESYVDPRLGAPLGEIATVSVGGDPAQVSIELHFPAAHLAAELASAVEKVVAEKGGAARVQVTGRSPAPGAARNLKPIQGVRNIIAVASGKGGVGKSTTAANLALALAYEGASVGLLDADIYGPSQPRMMGLTGRRPTSPDERTMVAPVGYGVKVMSIGFLIDEEEPMVWRGPMVTQALLQLLQTTRWGDLDYLVVDMPPGTGDTQLTMSQHTPLSGAVIVTTPQDIALLDARKGLKMFEKVQVPVLGVVENMSTHVCSKCGHEEHIFGAGGGKRMAEQYGVDLLGELPLDMRIREQADGGKPTVVADPEGALARAYIDLARRTAARLARTAQQAPAPFPNISVENT